MPVFARRAELRDRLRINELDEAFPAGATGNHIGEMPDEHFEVLLSYGRDRGMHFFVAEDAGRVVGFAQMHPRLGGFGDEDVASKTAMLSRIVVEQSARRSGAGALMLSQVEGAATELGISMLLAHVPGSAAPFYESGGWTVEAPGRAVAWIEQPSVELWQMVNDAGGSAGGRRPLTMLRTEDATADPGSGYDQMAFKLLAPGEIIEYFSFAFGGTGNTMIDALLVIVGECDADPQRYADLPVDVSKIVGDLLANVLGPTRADQIKRARR